MYCEEAKGLIQLYLDGELDARSTFGIQKHLESCVVCLHLLNSYNKQDQLLREAAREEMIDSSRMRARILAATTRKAKWYQRRPYWLMPVLKSTAAALIVILALAIFLLRGNLFPYVNQQVYAAAASDHIRCVTGASRGKSIEMSELRGFVTRFGKMQEIPSLAAFGYGTPHGILCKIKGEQFLHLVFNRPEGNPLSIYIRPRTSELLVLSPTSLKLEGYRLFSTSMAGIDILVVSSLDETRAPAIAQAIAQQVNR
ncbi:MAG: zf-HC2 domain-containing protein [Blastocatellia bacterium]|nr:zf-HC2 domain-containing protein [Blastocatellia bacterium]